MIIMLLGLSIAFLAFSANLVSAGNAIGINVLTGGYQPTINVHSLT